MGTASLSPLEGPIRTSRARAAFRLSLVLLLCAVRVGAATFTAQGTTLTVTSSNLLVSFNGADVVGIKNQITGETYLRNPSSIMQLNLVQVTSLGQSLVANGNWTVNTGGTSASIAFKDSVRTVTVTVSVDSATQEVVVDLDGKVSQGGLEKLIWGVTGFDMTAGKFMLPAQGGMSVTNASFVAQSNYYFNLGAWEAPFSLFQGAQGGVAIYSRDTQSLCKDLNLSPNQQQTANELFEVEAPGPWNTAVEAGPIEWRLAAYQGEWQAGARIYRDWHNSVVPPTPLSGSRAWANNIRTVIQMAQPYQTSDLDSLASVVIPAETLLYVFDWRALGYDVGYPDYSWLPSIPSFIAYAHKLGFYVMLHTDVLGVSPSSADFAGVQQFQLKDPLALQPQGWLWSQPASTSNRYAIMNPAAPSYRQLFVARVTPAIQALQPDAIHLDFSVIYNDGNGLIGGLNFNQGLAQLELDLLSAFPNVVLGLEESNDTIAPYASFSQPLYWFGGSGLSADTTPPGPVSAYALANVRRYWHLGVNNPYQSNFVPYLAQLEGQDVLPSFATPVADYTQADMVRWLSVIGTFQKYSLQPAWDTPWNGAELKYQGTNSSSATLTDNGALAQFNLQLPGSATALYQRAHASNQVASPPWVPNWPAYTSTQTLGLDPANQYWMGAAANNPSLPHITAMPSGSRLGLGTGTLVTPQFAYFQINPPATTTPFDFFGGLWLANTGISYNGTDYPLANGAFAYLQSMTVGGVSQQGILAPPPYMAQRGGETFFEYAVPLPVGTGYGATLSFEAGIEDYEIGLRQGPMTFKVEVNGAILWQHDISTGGWQAGSVNLSPYVGQTVKIRFVCNPGPSGNPNNGASGWSAFQLSIPGSDTLNGITLSVPAGVSSSNVVVTGGSSTVSNGTATINGLPPGGTILVVTGQPTSVAAGQSLLNIPFTLSQASSGGLAGTPVNPYSGTGFIGSATSGGVTKQALDAFAPPISGQTIISWLLQLPASPALALSLSAGLWDGHVPFSQGYLMSVRVNGTTLWQYDVNVPAAWEYGAVDLSPWSGKTIVLELITDSQGTNTNDLTSWGELTLGANGSANCAASLGSSNPLSAPAAGSSGTISVITPSSCNWTAAGEASWITVTSSGPAGNGSLQYTITANPGPPRQSSLVVAGHTIAISQGGASATTLAASPNPSTYGTYATLTAVVSPSSATGNVTFMDGSTTIGSGVLTGGTATLLVATLSAGVHSLTAVYNGDTNDSGSTSATVSLTVSAATGLDFYPITPCRVADTRSGAGFSGPFGPPSMSGGSTRTFNILSSACATGIPANVAAYALNFTVIPPSGGPAANLTTWPAALPAGMPNVSTLNFAGSVVANAAIVPAGANGAIAVYVNDPTDVLFDINGYFAPPLSSGLLFYPLTPCRIADTRTGAGFSGQFGPPAMVAGATRPFNLPASPCGVPAAASAYSLNFTVIPPGGGPAANLTTWPATQPTMPNVSTLNYSGGVVANAAIVPAGTNQSINVFVNDPTNMLFDTNGYFAPGPASGLHFYPITPCRIADTRTGAGFTGQFGPPTMTGGNTRTFGIPASPCGIPSGASAYSLNFTVIPPSGGPAANLTTWPAGATAMPNVSTLNYYGSVVANAAIVPAGTNGAINVFVNYTTDVLFDINGYFAP